MRIFLLLPLLIVSCSRTLVPVVTASSVGDQAAEVDLVPESEPELKKALSGKVTFTGLSGEELSEIRVIPETGRKVFVPVNRRYEQVDGLWWHGDRERWLKIPDHGEVWIGAAPKEFDGETKLGELKVYFRSHPFWAMANAMRGGVKEPGWVSDAGKTKSPVGWPW